MELETDLVVNLILVAVLVFLTAFFVATEFAIIKLRPSRVDQLVQEGRKGALAVQKVTSNLDGYLSACQLGITITALGIGALGEPTVEKILHPVFDDLGLSGEMSSFLSYLIAFVAMTYLHVVLGELAPKSVAINLAERIAFLTAKPIIWFHKVAYPFIWLLNGSANKLIRLFGMKPASEHEEAHTEEEIRIILSDSLESGNINKSEYGYVNNIFAFDDLLAREIMVPRTDMVCLYTNKSFEENLNTIRTEQYTRYPVVTDSKDNVIGFINTKKLFIEYVTAPSAIDLRSLIRPILTVPEVMPVSELLRKMQQEQVHMAILLDEYGGTSGLITIEDILEEIVGEIRDEFDSDEPKPIEKIADDHYIVDGKVLLSDINDLLGTDIRNEEVDSIGGWLYNQLSEFDPKSEITVDAYTFIVLEKENHRIRTVEIRKNSLVGQGRS